jgi:ABC-2 type transport system permease protein
MSSQFDPNSNVPAESPMTSPRPLYWSVRRELWENRFVYLAPLIVAAVVLFTTAIIVLTLPMRKNFAAMDAAQRHSAIVTPFSMAPAPIMLTTFLVGFFYCLDALNGERRDRSILFWKSLPVSDRTTVLSKVMIPAVVLPVIAIILGRLVQFILLLIGTAAFAGNRINPATTLWAEFRFFHEPVIMFYGMAVHVLWFAPIYGWLLLVSAWVRRAPLLWAVLPALAIAAVEYIAFKTRYFLNMLQYRMTGAMREAFALPPNHKDNGVIDRIWELSPGRFLSAPGLWVGLIFAVACVALAIHLRRNREPI